MAPTTITTTTPIALPPTTIIQDICKYGLLINYTASFSNLTNADIYDYEMENIIKTYCMKGSSVIVKGQHANFQVTTTLMEVKDRFNSDLSGLDLTECDKN